MKKLLLPLLGVTLLSGCVVVVGDVDDRPLEHFSKQLSVPADGLQQLNIEAGAGVLNVTGVAGLQKIEVDAEIWTYSNNHSDYQLSLEGFGRNAELVAKTSSRAGFRVNIGNSKRIDLNVRIPAHLKLNIDDGSGDITISAVDAKVKIEDGSGRLEVKGIGGDLTIDDGSGDIVVDDVAGNVSISDGSGDMYVSNVGQTLVIDDGSGDIEVFNIHNLKIEESGSGDVSVNDAD